MHFHVFPVCFYKYKKFGILFFCFVLKYNYFLIINAQQANAPANI